jgi:hypothetical protein
MILELEREKDGRWIADFSRLCPGCMAYGLTPFRAIAKAAKVLVLSLLLTACAHRPVHAPGPFNYFIGSDCHPTVELTNCDTNSPPNCQQSRTHYDKGCEKLEVK